MSDKVYNTLFLCTGNSARSIMAEVLLNNFGRDRFRAYSAGSRPGPQVNPLTIEVLQSARLPVEGLRSKSWDEFAKSTAPQLDFVITLCDSAAGEECPLWPGQPITAHWGFEDPSAFEGTAEAKRTYFDKIFRQIANRIKIFNSLPLTTLDRVAIKRELDALGNGATQTSATAT
ncbi:arsenate reductase [Pusillimonas sp. T7-7]|uniref:arsenate reductase ArsC n=1 Tax=Pusillimonas sp. (strain T7-7) TaxID=1007105 RepID=UPI00020853E1|nr:arsenate reductase ArsC [Pusillimonas sp. T7-7]AEC19630.1 arsenate reductase [Pusillimonas sp. T7-7]